MILESPQQSQELESEIEIERDETEGNSDNEGPPPKRKKNNSDDTGEAMEPFQNSDNEIFHSPEIEASKGQNKNELCEETQVINNGGSSEDVVESNAADSVSETLKKVEINLREWKKVNVCPECFMRVPHGNIIRHMREHHHPEKFPCSLCDKLYLRKEDLEKHICQK